MSVPDLTRLAELKERVDEARITARPYGKSWAAGRRQRMRWEGRATSVFEQMLLGVNAQVDMERTIRDAGLEVGGVKKASPSPEQVSAAVASSWPSAWRAVEERLSGTVPEGTLAVVGDRAMRMITGLLSSGESLEAAMSRLRRQTLEDLEAFGVDPADVDRALDEVEGSLRQAAQVGALAQRAVDQVAEGINAQVGDERDFSRGGMQTYLSLASDISEESGQSTLDQLGLDHTFRWTSVRDMPRDQFAIRGSKILQHAVGSHGRELARMVLEATDPAQPRTIQALTRDIQRRWDVLTRSQAQRIARTETAAIWETTNWNTMRANGIQKVEWTIARGPSIGPPKSYPVCPFCLREAAGSPYPIEGVELPPKHPNCRCTLVPVLDGWLPPAETWAGGPEPPLPLHPAAAE